MKAREIAQQIWEKHSTENVLTPNTGIQIMNCLYGLKEERADKHLLVARLINLLANLKTDAATLNNLYGIHSKERHE